MRTWRSEGRKGRDEDDGKEEEEEDEDDPSEKNPRLDILLFAVSSFDSLEWLTLTQHTLQLFGEKREERSWGTLGGRLE